MAYGVGPILDISGFVAASDLSQKQYHIVEISADGKVDVCNNAADRPLGILQNKPRQGEAAIVRILGISQVVSDAALTLDSNYGTSADGQAVVKTVEGDLVLGRVLEATGNAGEIATVTVNGLSLAQV
jgi:hypothetical protein